eukprot:6183867-Pleurochrysis_carterae.AAC.1
MTSRGCNLHGTKGKWRVGRDTHSSFWSVSTATAAAGACATRPGWWKARTVMSSQPERTSTPPSPACGTMSRSAQSMAAAARLSVSRSSWRTPSNRVSRVDRRTGWQSSGSAQSQTTPLAQAGISSCVITTVGTFGTRTSAPPARARSAASAAWAARNHACTFPS